MKKITLILSILFTSIIYGQTKQSPLIVLNAKKIGFMQDNKKEMDAINPDDISTLTVYKDSLNCKKYDSNSGVIIITTKKFILNTFYKNNIENSQLKEKIKSPEDLLNIGIVNGDSKSKNQPYDELSKYIDTYTINEKIKKIAEITFINPRDSIQLNPLWINGAIKIASEIEQISLN
jgi:hypothetical protein